MKKFSIFLIVGTVLIEAGLISGLLTEYWIISQEFHLGVLRHSYYTQNATRIDHVDSILSDVFDSTTVWFTAIFWLIVSACICAGTIAVIVIIPSCCSFSDEQERSKIYISIRSTFLFILCSLESAALAIFMAKIEKSIPFSRNIGWSLGVEFAALGVSVCLLIIQVVVPCYCKDSCRNSSTVGVSNTAVQFKQPPDDTSVKVGDSVCVEAEVDNANKVRWFKGTDRVIRFSTSHSEEFNKDTGLATLKISSARFQDDGDYSCVAERYDTKQEIKNKFHLHVLPVKPVFTKQLEDACVNLDDQIILEAKVKQAELITWQHDGSDVTPLKDKRKILYLQGKATLKISNATLKDAGEYICKARSKGASLVEVETTSICHVSVHDALCPSFEDVPGDQNIKAGSMFEIVIKVKGYPKPEHVTWYNGEDTIERSRRINMQYSNGVAKLKVYDSCAGDSGLYECVAENKHGNNTCRISVKVESKQMNTAECPVCRDKPPNKRLPCGHAICGECMERIGGICPIDRTEFNIREASNLYLA